MELETASDDGKDILTNSHLKRVVISCTLQGEQEAGAQCEVAIALSLLSSQTQGTKGTESSYTCMPTSAP